MWNYIWPTIGIMNFTGARNESSLHGGDRASLPRSQGAVLYIVLMTWSLLMPRPCNSIIMFQCLYIYRNIYIYIYACIYIYIQTYIKMWVFEVQMPQRSETCQALGRWASLSIAEPLTSSARSAAPQKSPWPISSWMIWIIQKILYIYG